MSIDMMTPSEAATCSGEINKRSKSYRLIAIKSKLQDEIIAEEPPKSGNVTYLTRRLLKVLSTTKSEKNYNPPIAITVV